MSIGAKEIIRKDKTEEINFIEDEILEEEKQNINEPNEPSENLLFIREMIAKTFDVSIIDMISDLQAKEIPLYASCFVLAQYFDDKILYNFLQSVLRMKLSNKRQSRNELIKLITQATQENNLSPENFGSQLFGKGI